MKKAFIILILSFLLLSFAYGQDNTVEINGADFEIPNKYLGGKSIANGYKLDNVFSIKCIDNNSAKFIGLWAEEKDFSKDLSIGNHPVRHYCQYNQYVKGNHSHAYFVSGKSIYEISWVGENIDGDIEKLIRDAPDSKIDDDTFYKVLDKSYEAYKVEKIDKLNHDSEYNYLEAKYQSSMNQQKTQSNIKLNEILLTYYN